MEGTIVKPLRRFKLLGRLLLILVFATTLLMSSLAAPADGTRWSEQNEGLIMLGTELRREMAEGNLTKDQVMELFGLVLGQDDTFRAVLARQYRIDKSLDILIRDLKAVEVVKDELWLKRTPAEAMWWGCAMSGKSDIERCTRILDDKYRD